MGFNRPRPPFSRQHAHACSPRLWPEQAKLLEKKTRRSLGLKPKARKGRKSLQKKARSKKRPKKAKSKPSKAQKAAKQQHVRPDSSLVAGWSEEEEEEDGEAKTKALSLLAEASSSVANLTHSTALPNHGGHEREKAAKSGKVCSCGSVRTVVGGRGSVFASRANRKSVVACCIC